MPAPTLGDERRQAPRLLPGVLASLLALPLEHPDHGHPGLLFGRRSGGDGVEPETWLEVRAAENCAGQPLFCHACAMRAYMCRQVPGGARALLSDVRELGWGGQGYRVCYSFSAKGSVTNLVADSLQQAGDQELAGWFLVGEGRGLQYASGVAAAMYSQFRLALSKAFAGLDKSLDEAAFERACAICSRMTGIVLLRSVTHLDDATGENHSLSYEVHEFSFPLTRQKFEQEIRAKLKSNADVDILEETSTASAGAAPSSSVCEVVDLISDDDERDDDHPIIILEDAGKTSREQFAVGGGAGTALSGACCPDGPVEAAQISCTHGSAPPALEEGADQNCEAIAWAKWRQAGAYERWCVESEAIRADPTRAATLFEGLERQRQKLFESLRTGAAGSPGAQASSKDSGGVDRRMEQGGCPQGVSAAAIAGKTSLGTGRQRVSAKLHLGVRARASADGVSAGSGASETAALSQSLPIQAPANADQKQHGVVEEAVASASIDPSARQLDLSLQEYDEACKDCSELLVPTHAKARAATRPAEKDVRDDDCPLILNSVLASILHIAFSQECAREVHGILAGVRRGKQIVVSHALATSQDLPSCGGAEVAGVGAAWLRHQAQTVFAHARLLPEAAFDREYNAPVENARQDDASARECVPGIKEELITLSAHGEVALDEIGPAAGSRSNGNVHDDPVETVGGVKVEGLGRATCCARDAQTEASGLAVASVDGEPHDGRGSHRLSCRVKSEEEEQRVVPRLEDHPSVIKQEGCLEGRDSTSEKEHSNKADGHVLIILGYFRVCSMSSAAEVDEGDRRRLCALNGQGLGLLCSVQENRQVGPSLDLAKFRCFGVEAQPSSPLVWKVEHDPFLPRRVLQQWASAAQGRPEVHDENAAAAALVMQHIKNLKVQVAYIKRQLSLSSIKSQRAHSCCGAVCVGRQLPPQSDTEELEDSHSERGKQIPGSATVSDYAGHFETCPTAPGER